MSRPIRPSPAPGTLSPLGRPRSVGVLLVPKALARCQVVHVCPLELRMAQRRRPLAGAEATRAQRSEADGSNLHPSRHRGPEGRGREPAAADPPQSKPAVQVPAPAANLPFHPPKAFAELLALAPTQAPALLALDRGLGAFEGGPAPVRGPVLGRAAAGPPHQILKTPSPFLPRA